MKRLLISLVILLIFMTGIIVPVEAQGENKNIPSSWAAEEIEKAIEYDLVTNKVLSIYRQDITREEFCELAVKLYEALSGNKIEVPATNIFKDTDNTEILRANKLGIVNGVAEDRFAPFNRISREEIAVMLYRTIMAVDSDLSVGEYYITFADKQDVSSWAGEAVGFMSENDILGGIGGNMAGPKENTTREQAIALVKRTFEAFNEEITYQPYTLDFAVNIIYVPQNAKTIQSGIDRAKDGDVVMVASGTYYENIDFSGKNIIVTSENGPKQTVINGDFEGSVVTFKNNEKRSAVLHGFTIKNGMSGLSGAEQNPDLYPNGGGISIRDASPTISGNMITKNAAVNFGGGISIENESSKPLIENNHIKSNITHYQAAGIGIMNGASPIVRGNIIYDNTCEAIPGILVAGGSGGLIENNIIKNNVPGYDHEPFHMLQYLKDDPSYYQWRENWGQHPAFPGGVLIVQNSNPTVRNNRISGNDGGGIGVMLGSSPLIEGNTISHNGNIAMGAVTGGIMAAHDVRFELTDNTFTWNKGPDIWVDRRNSTIVNKNGIEINLINLVNKSKVGDNMVNSQVIAWPLERPETQMSANPRTIKVPEDYPAIQDAIDVAKDGDTIVVAPGTYNENINFCGKQITVTSQNPLDESVVKATVINGGNTGAVDKGQGPIVMFLNGEGRQAVLEGFTLHNRDRDFFNMNAIYLEGASPTIRNNAITSNNGTGIRMNWAYSDLYVPDQPEDAGRFTAIQGMETAPLIQNNIIRDCGDGGMWFYYASPEIIGNKFIDNEGSLSGGIHNWFSRSIITGNEFIGNKGVNGGGIHYENFSVVQVAGNLFKDSYSGGAIYIDSPTYGSINSNLFDGNHARPGSAMAIGWGAEIDIVNNLITGNYGWALYAGGAKVTLTNNTFANNYPEDGAKEGEDIFVMGGIVEGVNNIFYNTGMSVWEGEEGGELILNNCLFYNNNRDTDLWPGDDNFIADPKFLGDGNYHLRTGSPAIDSGRKVKIKEDIDGATRPQGKGYDIGAYEFITQ